MTLHPQPRISRRALLLAGAARAALPRLAGAAPARQSDAPPLVKGIYLNPTIVSDDADRRALIDLVAATELNAIVIDVKEEGVYVETAQPIYAEAGAVRPWFEVKPMLAALHERDIRAVARFVVFKDNPLAQHRPDLAIHDVTTGQPWVDDGGNMWLNPLNREVWEATVTLAEELARQGFDEIQFDYVRFPSDGDLSLLDYGQPVDNAQKIATITDFLAFATKRVNAAGADVSADVFGYTLLDDDIGIGQDVRDLKDAVQILSPMLYPSHFPDGSVNVPGRPNDFPGETIAISMQLGAERMPTAQIRPWLQDFTLPGMTEYFGPQVRAQIDAAEAGGASGWLIWNAAGVYNTDAFLPAGADQTP